MGYTVADGCGTARDETTDPRHKVFLSHSGAQKDFVEQLCVDLERCDRYPFFDKLWHSLPIGRNFPKLIFEAIEQCEVGVVVLSEEFFTVSKWPMLELVAMTRNPELVIVPVYLWVSLDQVRDPKHQEKWVSIWRGWAEMDKRIDIGEWRGALKALGPVNSLIYDRVSEVRFREKIVKAVCDIVPPQIRWKDSHVQGRARLCQVVGEKINQAKVSKKYGVALVGLYGVGGSGKTTICQTLCNEYTTVMRGRVFHAELGSASDLDLLQGALKSLTDKGHDVFCGLNISQCQDLLQREMRKQAVFLAIDNMSDTTKSIQQAKLFLTAGFGNGSIVVITARSLEVLKLRPLDIDETDCWEMPELQEDEAKSLFIEHAVFDIEERAEVDDEIVGSCLNRCYFQKGDGKRYHYHPLALKVLGIQLGCARYDRNKWAGALREVDTFNRRGGEEHPVFSILRKSFDVLLPMDRMLFMDVALFMPVQRATTSGMTWFEWLSMVHGSSVHDIMERLEGLKGKSLLQDLGGGRSTEIGMHDLWREFAVIESRAGEFEGRRWVYEVGESSALEEGTPSGGHWQNMKRMCFSRNGLMSASRINLSHFSNIVVMKLVSNGTIVHAGLVLELNTLKHLKSLQVEVDHGVTVEVGELGPVKNLQFLYLSGARISAAAIEDIGHLTNLRVLVLTDIDGEKLPDVSKLVSLEEVQFSNCFQAVVVSGLSSRLSKLRVLTVLHCRGLRSLGHGAGDLVALQELQVVDCVELAEFPNLQKLTNLRELMINGCSKIASLRGLDDLVALEELWASNCSCIVELPNLQKLTKLQEFRVDGCSKIASLRGLDDLVALKRLWVSGCSGIVELPNLQKLTNLQELTINRCSKIASLRGLDDLVALEKLLASYCSDIVELPNLQKLTKLRELIINGCSKIASLRGLDDLVALEELWASDCNGIVELLNLQKLTNLQELMVDGCSKIASLRGLDDLVALEKLLASYCSDIVELPNLQKLTKLRELIINGCSKIASLRGLDDLVALEELWASDCNGIVELLNLQKLTNLQELMVDGCSKIASLRGLDDLVALEALWAFGCNGIVELPNLQKLTKLRELRVDGCSQIASLPGLNDLGCLEKLWASGCSGIVELPNLQKLTKLRELTINRCSKIASLRSLDDLVALEALWASGCSGIVELPNLQKLTKLQELAINRCSKIASLRGLDDLVALKRLWASGCSGIVELPNLQKLTKLQEFRVDGCSKIASLQGLDDLVALEELWASGCSGIVELPNVQKLTKLQELRVDGCSKIASLRGLDDLGCLEKLWASGCSGIVELPNVQKLTKLQELRVNGCSKIASLRGLDDLVALEKLLASYCNGIVELPNLQKFPKLREHRVDGCSKIASLQGLDDLVALVELWASDCNGIVELPNLQKLTKLQELTINRCSKIASLRGLDDLVALEKLSASYCSGIVELPNLQKLTKLRELIINGCSKIASLQGLDDLVALERILASGCSGVVELPKF